MSEQFHPTEQLTKIGFPSLPPIPHAWKIDGNYEDFFANTLDTLQYNYDNNIHPYFDKNIDRLRTSAISIEEKQWFAGFIDEGTRISFDRNGNFYYPVLSRADVDSSQRALALLRLGGSIQDNEIKQNPNEPKTLSWRWFARGQTAISILEQVADSLLIKDYAYEEFNIWKNADKNTRVELAQNYKGKQVPESKHFDSLTLPYIAGLFDSCGVISSVPDRGKSVLATQMYLKNEELAKYLQSIFGGTYWNKHENRDFTIYDKTFHTENDQYVWRTQQNTASNFLSNIRPFTWLTSEMIDQIDL